MDISFIEEQVIIHEEKALRGTLTLPKIDIKNYLLYLKDIKL